MKNLLIKLCSAVVLMALPFVNAQAAGGNNHAAIFLGATSGSDHTDPTVGIEYEYLLPVMDKQLGLGVVGEGIFGDPKALVYVAGIVYHPKQVPGLKANLSFGGETKADHNETVVRVGVGYDLHYNNISYGPVYNFDTIGSHEAHVFGIAVGMGF